MIDFYYWGLQCPYNHSNKKVLEEIKEEFDLEVNYYDMSENHELTEKLDIYSPTMTIFDKQLRWSGPLTPALIKKYLSGQVIKRKAFIVDSKNIEVRGVIKPFQADMHGDIKDLCCQKGCRDCSHEKGQWMARIMHNYSIKNLGMLHYLNDVCVAGVEYVPSLEVPYNIPKSRDYAFLTCLFPSHEIYDYRSYPLKALEEDLKSQSYSRVYAIASEKVSFPNGPLKWFLKEGYKDLGALYYEENDHANQHLVEKIL
jgi:hypothetical protein